MTGVFVVTWAFAVLVAGVPVGAGQFNESEPYADRATCELHVESHKARVADYVRGKIGAHWSVEIVVDGGCAAVGEPA